MSASLLFADNENGEKDKGEKDEKAVRLDSLSGDTIYDEIDLSEDTLVFEDWEGPGVPGGTGSSVMPSEQDEEGEEELTHNNSTPEFIPVTEGVQSAELHVYPNPVASTLYIESSTEPDYVVVKDFGGRSVSVHKAVNSLDVSEYKGGMYFIELIFNDHIETVKFIKSP